MAALKKYEKHESNIGLGLPVCSFTTAATTSRVM
jgi:hypothetical protein